MHQSALATGASIDNSNLHMAVSGLAAQIGRGGLDRVSARGQAYARVYGELIRQSTAMSFVDAYWLLGVGSGVMFFTAFFVRKNNTREGGSAGMAH
jgi:DHA2 family multidrug resistance protein